MSSFSIRETLVSRRLLLVLLVIGLGGCVENFVADVDAPSPPPLVVDGRVLSGPGPHTVTLSTAAAFEQSVEGIAERIDDARVLIVNDSTNTETQLRQTGPGEYQTEEGELVGTPGHTYHLEVTLPDGRQYRSVPAQMPEPVPLDSVFAEFTSSPTPRISVFATADDPKGTTNYYRWSVRNVRRLIRESLTPPFRCWKRKSPSQIPILEDRLLDSGRIQQRVFSIPTGRKTSTPNQVDVQQLTITEEAHDFWLKVEEQVEDFDDPFSAPPNPIRGNIVPVQDSLKRALGYFEVAGASRESTVCFRQQSFEDAPRASRRPPRCPNPELGVPGVVFDPPSNWVCTDL